MNEREQQKRYRDYLKGELEGAAKYEAMAGVEKDPERAEAFRRLAGAEMRHAARWASRIGLDPATIKPARVDAKLRLLKLVARLFGTSRIMPLLLRGEDEDIRTYAADPEARGLALEERSHGRTLRRMSMPGPLQPADIIRSEGQQAMGTGGSLRAAVLGVNDGLVSNLSLVMGVAGGTGDPKVVLFAGLAGLLAGGFSMAAGEYVSMRSQRDVYEHQIELERWELENWPEEEEAELALLYRLKGMTREEAQQFAHRLIANPDVAMDTMTREELGLDPNELGSPWRASASSFGAFVAGAVVPLIPYLAGAGGLAFVLSATMSAAALAVVGGLLALLSGRSVAWGAGRMLIAGGAAAAVTFGLGTVVGGALLG